MDPENNLNSVYSYTLTFQDQNTLPNSPDKSMNILNNNESNKVKNLNYSTIPSTQSYYKPIKSIETSYLPVNQNYGYSYNYENSYVPNYYTPRFETPNKKRTHRNNGSYILQDKRLIEKIRIQQILRTH